LTNQPWIAACAVAEAVAMTGRAAARPHGSPPVAGRHDPGRRVGLGSRVHTGCALGVVSGSFLDALDHRA
jgi:hypothetical protein